jgi:hypothetical protein
MLKIVIEFFQRMTNGRHDRTLFRNEVRIVSLQMQMRIASLRRAVYSFAIKKND